ncbi:MAG: hypothetical protein U0531_07705 [Dehalococcoidia bacterium]
MTTAVFTDVYAARMALRALITEADRHGSMVWEAAEDSGGLCRSVSVALDDALATVARPAIYLVEIWAAAAGAPRTTVASSQQSVASILAGHAGLPRPAAAGSGAGNRMRS